MLCTGERFDALMSNAERPSPDALVALDLATVRSCASEARLTGSPCGPAALFVLRSVLDELLAKVRVGHPLRSPRTPSCWQLLPFGGIAGIAGIAAFRIAWMILWSSLALRSAASCTCSEPDFPPPLRFLLPSTGRTRRLRPNASTANNTVQAVDGRVVEQGDVPRGPCCWSATQVGLPAAAGGGLGEVCWPR